jgi:hypothetical protein
MPPFDQNSIELIALNATDLKGSWEQIRTKTEGRLSDWGIQLLRQGLDKYAKSVVVEPLYVCKDYRNLFSHFYSKKFVPRSPYCSRLHFFNRSDLTLDNVILESEKIQEFYIGYSIVEPVAARSIGRTFVDPLKLGRKQEEFFCLRTRSVARIAGAQYQVLGFPYRSQSGEAIVCAHTALWATCRYLSDRYSAYGEILPYDLIEMTGDANGRRVPYRAMTYADYSSILSSFGCHPAILRPRTAGAGDKDWSKDPESFYDLYAYMESGFPVLASFAGHVVNIIGHTLSDQLDKKHLRNKGFFNSAALLKEYIVIDDNFFPYQLLTYKGKGQYFPAKSYSSMAHPPFIDNIFAAIVPLPEKAFMRPGDARHLGVDFLNIADTQRVIQLATDNLGISKDSLVVRQLLTTSSAFKRRKIDYYLRTPADSLLIFPISLNLPHFLWILEISSESLYKDRKCFGEIVVDATLGKHEWEPIYVRLGQTIVKGDNEQEDKLVPFTYPQYTHNLGRL